MAIPNVFQFPSSRYQPGKVGTVDDRFVDIGYVLVLWHLTVPTFWDTLAPLFFVDARNLPFDDDWAVGCVGCGGVVDCDVSVGLLVCFFFWFLGGEDDVF